MTKYHVNRETGRANICRATGKRGCPLGAETPHFDNKQQATDYIVKTEAQKNDQFSVMKKKNNDAVLEDDNVEYEKTHRKLNREIDYLRDADQYLHDGIVVSSRIAECLEEGDVEGAQTIAKQYDFDESFEIDENKEEQFIKDFTMFHQDIMAQREKGLKRLKEARKERDELLNRMPKTSA